MRVRQIPLDEVLLSKKALYAAMSTRMYKQIVSSTNEVGLIEPLSGIQPNPKAPEYLVLDNLLRVLALKEICMGLRPDLLAKDEETFLYNHHINQLPTVTVAYTKVLLKATPLEQRVDTKPAEREMKSVPIEQID